MLSSSSLAYSHAPYQASENGFEGLCSVFITAAFAFTGIEFVVIAATEADNPRKTVLTASKQVFWHISLFCVVSLFILSLIVPSNDLHLGGASGANSKYSLFVCACTLAGIEVLSHAFNAVVTLSVANSCPHGLWINAHGLGPCLAQHFTSDLYPH